jgi:hypothetical protein
MSAKEATRTEQSTLALAAGSALTNPPRPLKYTVIQIYLGSSDLGKNSIVHDRERLGDVPGTRSDASSMGAGSESAIAASGARDLSRSDS